jgi:aminopeptidase
MGFNTSGEHCDIISTETFYRAAVDTADHWVRIIAEEDKYLLRDIPSEKLVLRKKALKPLMDWRFEKEYAGKMTWTLASYATPAMADDVQLSLEEYWDQIIKACYLDEADPIAKWREIWEEQVRIKKVLNDMQIEKVHVEGEHIDLWLTFGTTRQWLAGSGHNIPSFEFFITPDWRGTEGTIYFNQPLYRYGNRISDITLTFKEGRVVTATASENEQLLKDMIAIPNADKLGEFSLTDGRMSRITHFMGETLFDENRGGEQGNTHVALGFGYKDSYVGGTTGVIEQQWEEMGFNTSGEHCDIISTEKRKVTALLPDGSEKVIYDNGKFTI